MTTYSYRKPSKLKRFVRSVDWDIAARALAVLLLIALVLLGLEFFILSLTSTLAQAQEIVPGGTITTTEVCYKKAKYNSSGTWVGWTPTCEKFKAPEIRFETNEPVKYIDASPLDPSRNVFELPTFPLAEFHWWIFDVERERSQQQYAECVGQIALCQEFLGEYPLLTDPAHPFYSTIASIRNYTVPFNPINPRTLEFARANADAAIFTVNLNVYHTSLCKQTLSGYKQRVFTKLQGRR
jgi:hypothetical protein